MCDKYIYKVSLFATKKHLKPVYSKFYLTEQETRFIYANPFITGIYENGEMRVSVIKVCNESREYKIAQSNSVLKKNIKDNINFVIKD
tara:strand:+ start:1413 stop:1676 length:264 start_codon:yes stop_codon:yes gene_type:complete